MGRDLVIDTSSLEELDADGFVAPQEVVDEAENRGVSTGLVKESKDSSVESVGQCVNDNIKDDIQKTARRELDVMQKRDISQLLGKAEKVRSERDRQDVLRRAWEELEESASVKSWQGEVRGASTDCAVLGAAESEGSGIVSQDKTILDMCEDSDEDLNCMRID